MVTNRKIYKHWIFRISMKIKYQTNQITPRKVNYETWNGLNKSWNGLKEGYVYSEDPVAQEQSKKNLANKFEE